MSFHHTTILLLGSLSGLGTQFELVANHVHQSHVSMCHVNKTTWHPLKLMTVKIDGKGHAIVTKVVRRGISGFFKN